MVRKHASLEKDQEINEAGWVATQGAAVGAAKVRSTPIIERKCFHGDDDRYQSSEREENANENLE